MNRRQFLENAKWQIIKWSPWLGLLGLRFHAYNPATAAACGYRGWVMLAGRLVGFVPR